MLKNDWEENWDATKFNWRSVIKAPTFDPSIGFIFVLGIGIGLFFGPIEIGLIVIGLLALGIVLEWTYIVVTRGMAERQRLRAYRKPKEPEAPPISNGPFG